MTESKWEKLPNGIKVFYSNPVFGERRWLASPPGCCGVSIGYTRDEAIQGAMHGCEWCGAKPIKGPRPK